MCMCVYDMRNLHQKYNSFSKYKVTLPGNKKVLCHTNWKCIYFLSLCYGMRKDIITDILGL